MKVWPVRLEGFDPRECGKEPFGRARPTQPAAKAPAGVRSGPHSGRKANDLALRATNARSHNGGLGRANKNTREVRTTRPASHGRDQWPDRKRGVAWMELGHMSGREIRPQAASPTGRPSLCEAPAERQPRKRRTARERRHETPRPSRPPLSCRTSPPQGGRLAVTAGFANRRRCRRGRRQRSLQSPPLRGRWLASQRGVQDLQRLALRATNARSHSGGPASGKPEGGV